MRSSPRRATGPAIDVVVESARWHRRPQAAMLLRRAIITATPPSAKNAELAVVLTNDRAMRAINHQWRGQNKTTNVLAFPAATAERSAAKLLGDIVIAYETVGREAKAQGKPFDHHLVHLAVHGFLHLLGYDHDSSEAAEEMERLERKVLARLDIPDPYATRDAEA